MRLGSFELVQLDFPDSIIKEEKRSNLNCRQVAAVVLFNPDGSGICLTISSKAGNRGDGLLNLSPPQGGIGDGHEYETLFQAAAREVREELMVDLEKIVYLGSARRLLAADHPKALLGYKTQHYHWVCGYSRSWRLLPAPKVLEEAKWWEMKDAIMLAHQQMSPAKGDMFRAALDETIRRVDGKAQSQLVA